VRSALTRRELEGVRARDPSALEAFFEGQFDRVYGLVARLVHDRATAEDLTQDVFLRIHRAVHRLDPERDPWPWVATITYNVCRDHWSAAAERHGQRTVSLDDDAALAASLPDPAAGPESRLNALQRDRVVQEALLQLPEEGRVLVLFHDYGGLGHDEIAAMTGQSHAAVRQRYRRALARLGHLLRSVLG
jgi:RNA polymerase sigma-70 factor (ECF subfamily)